ncbi:hypothetical protein NMG60_11000062 [Bertholletia excelsa]
MSSPLLSSSIPCLVPCSSQQENQQRRKLILFATALPSSTRVSTKIALNNPVLAERADRLCPTEVSSSIQKSGFNSVEQDIGSSTKKGESKPEIDQWNSGLQVESLIKRIKALPTSQKPRIVDLLGIDGGSQTIPDFNNLLMALLAADELELALQLYSNLSYNRLVPNRATFSIIVRCYCKKNEPNEAKRVIAHMIKLGMQPNVATFTVLINTLSRSGRVDQALEIMEIMGRLNCEPTMQTYNCLLKGLCYVGKVERASKMLTNIKNSSMRPDIYTYTAVMDGFCKVGRSDEALDLLAEALEMGLTPSSLTFNTLFTGYCKEGRPLEGIRLLKRMKDRSCMPDYISYSTFMHGLLKWGEIHTALRIYKEMESKRFQADERIMNSLLRGLCRRSRQGGEMLRNAYEVFDIMKKWGSAIYASSYDLVIEAFCNGKDEEKAMVNLQHMISAGNTPKKFTFNRVIQALCVEAKVEEALSILILMNRESAIPNKFSFNTLIIELNRQGKHLCARSLYGAALKVGIIPDNEPIGCLSERNALV